MTLRPDFKFVLFFWLMLMVDAGWTQGPAFLGGGQSARYEEAAGYFHYLSPCKVAADGSQVREPGTGIDATPALCWPIRASRVRMVDGKMERSPVVQGTLIVSAIQVRFIPGNPKDAEYKAESPITNVLFRHDGGKVFANLSMAGSFYQFAFDNFCVECVQGSPPLDPAKEAQLDAEYGEVADSLKQFEVVHKRIVDVAALVLLRVRPGDQPTTDDPPEAMGLYSKLNRGLAEACPEPAKTCLRSYEAYQTCEAGAGKDCGMAPACSAACALTPQVLKAIGAGLCQAPRQDSAALFPDWTDVLKKEEAERAANPQAHVWAPKGSASTDGCTVLGEYRLAETKYAVEKGRPGSASISEGPVHLSEAVTQGILLKRVDPVYTAVARAARVHGTVVMHAIISKEGKVVEVVPVSGPDLLRSAAVTAVRQWVYKPYLLNGKPMAVDTLVFVNFNFDGATHPASSTPSGVH